MASNTSRKRKHSDCQLDHSAEREICTASARTGHGYKDTAIGENARAHLGDVYAAGGVVNYNYGQAQVPAPEDSRWKDFLEALAFERMDSRLAAILPAHDRTCRWVFNNERYLRWRNPALRSSHNGLLWIKGKAGAGKSTMMRCILEHFKKEAPDYLVISFFFNARGELLERSVEGMYRSLLCQLLSKIPRLRDMITIPLSFRKDQSWEVGVLRDLLREAILGLQQEPLVFVVDALDESDEKDVRSMVGFLDNMVAEAQSKEILLQICYASRHYKSLLVRRCEELVLEDQKKHTDDIHAYISRNLVVDCNLQQSDIRLRLQKKAQGVFLWVVLVVQQLNEKHEEGATPNELLETLTETPGDVYKMIHSIVNKGSSNKRLFPTLLWVMLARPSLSLTELYQAVRFSADRVVSLSNTGDDNDPERMRRFIIGASKGLVELKKKQNRHFYAQLIHESVREYLLASGLVDLCPDLRPNLQARGHQMLAGWCQSCIRSIHLGRTGDKFEPPFGLHATTALEELRLERAMASESFLQYAFNHILYHIEKAYLGDSFELGSLQDFPLEQYIRMYNSFWFETPLKSSATLLYILLEGGREVIFRALLQHLATSMRHECNHRGFGHSTEAECAGCSLRDMLNLDCGGSCGTLLRLATKRRDIVSMKLLLDRGAEADIRTEDGFGLIYMAIRHAWDRPGSESVLPVIQLLLNNGVDPNSPAGTYGSNLALAALMKHSEIVALLLEHGADVNAQLVVGRGEYQYRSALEAATRSSYFDPEPTDIIRTAEILLDYKAQPDPEILSTLLVDAAGIPAPSSIKRLLSLGANPNYSGDWDFGALHRAAISGTSEDTNLAMRYLLESGANVNAVAEDRTALIEASSRGNDQAVTILLEFNADIEYRGEEGTAMETSLQHLKKLKGHGYEWYEPFELETEIGNAERVFHLLREAGAQEQERVAGCRVAEEPLERDEGVRTTPSA